MIGTQLQYIPIAIMFSFKSQITAKLGGRDSTNLPSAIYTYCNCVPIIYYIKLGGRDSTNFFQNAKMIRLSLIVQRVAER